MTGQTDAEDHPRKLILDEATGGVVSVSGGDDDDRDHDHDRH
jgi:phospholipase C